MTNPSAILSEIAGGDLHTILTHRLLDATPFIFGGNRSECLRWKTLLADRLVVDPYSVLIVGSASLGVSLNPTKAFRPFSEESDVDVAVISSRYFDQAWHYFRNLGAEIYRLPRPLRDHVKSQAPEYVYWGAIATDRVLPFLPFGRQWLEALSEMSSIAPTIDRRVKVRLYRDVESLRSYQWRSLRNAQDRLLGGDVATDA